MQNFMSFFSHPFIKKLDQELDGVFKNAPHLPKKISEVLAKIAPYLVLVSGLFMITGGLRSIFGANDFHRLFNFWQGIHPAYFYITGLLQIIAGVVSVVAYQPLKERKMLGWLMMFSLNLLTLLMNLISVFFFRGGLFGLIFGLLISFYLLYELKGEYHLANTVKAAIKKEVKKIKSKNK